MKKLLLALSAVMLVCGVAGATTIQFDPTGTGNFYEIEAWNLATNPEANDKPVGAITVQDWWSYEDGAGNFTEDFTLQLNDMDVRDLGTMNLYSYNLYADISLEGFVVFGAEGGGLATFTAGSAKIYVDNDGNGAVLGADDNYDEGIDTPVADFELMVPAYMPLEGTVLDLNLAGDIDLIFRFAETYEDFFGDTEDQLADKQWLLALMGGRIQLAERFATDNGAISGWDTSNIDTQFTAVPEPSTLILLGCGLVGIAAVGRKRFSKKN